MKPSRRLHCRDIRTNYRCPPEVVDVVTVELQVRLLVAFEVVKPSRRLGCRDALLVHVAVWVGWVVKPSRRLDCRDSLPMPKASSFALMGLELARICSSLPLLS